MIPKPLYEILPYTYFLVGSGLWLLGNSPLEILGGILLYCASAQQWVLRTNYRRPDRIRANIINRRHDETVTPRYRKHFIPEGVYEALPFIYIAIGYSVAVLANSSLIDGDWSAPFVIALLTAVIFTASGFIVLLLRSRNRQEWSTHRMF